MHQQQIQRIALGNHLELCPVRTANQFIEFSPSVGCLLFFGQFLLQLLQLLPVLLLLQKTCFDGRQTPFGLLIGGLLAGDRLRQMFRIGYLFFPEHQFVDGAVQLSDLSLHTGNTRLVFFSLLAHLFHGIV